jgi:hypothetical protein
MSEDSKSISRGMVSRVMGRAKRPTKKRVAQAATGTRGKQMRMNDHNKGTRIAARDASKFRAELQFHPCLCTLSCVPINHLVRFLFDSVPTRFCLGTWQTMLSSPLLVSWKSNPLALGPRLNALLLELWSFEY